ncbi:conserved unknown protein [Ectocarpus siliculosus]|uniref:Kinesin-like protein n=1 Tax=Ectocarpus siliculosus TaxID=2880 RepID=D7FLM8_ECTSI|nr:conserved unknown protein [Ectocarpus siliculosus]|eukprot:CBJ25844.1 conserved unknown protein [Ectocarpus siliculosus]
MTAEGWNRHSTEGWRRGQLESLKLMSKSQAALLRAYAVDRIHERDSLVEAALAFVVSTAETTSSIGGSGSTSANDENGYDAKAVQELLEWRERLGEETKNLDLGDAVDGRLSEELKHLRKECRLQARKLELMQHNLETREDKENELRRKLRKSETLYSKLRDLLRDVREELAAREKDGVVPKEDFEHLCQKYDRAKAKIRALKDVAETFLPGDSRDTSPLPTPRPRGDSSRPEDQAKGAGGNIDPTELLHGDRVSNATGEARNEEPKADSAKAADSGGPVEGKAVASTFDAAGGGKESSSSAGDGGSDGRDNSGEAVATKGEEDNGGNGDEAEEAASVEVVVEEKRLLRLELDEANRKMEKARRGRKAAEKEKEGLVGAMATELGELEKAKDGQIRVANRESRLDGVDGLVADMRKQYAREYRERRRLFNVVQELRGNIRVLCRCRPRTAHDKGGGVCVSFPGEGGIELVNERGKRKAWKFDQVFGLEARQEMVYAEVSPLVISVLDGYNACIFAYGQTGTGKTYTMMGPPRDRGVNARALGDLFSRSAARRGEVDDTITLSILEIYNEHIRDLLIESTAFGGEQRKLEASTWVRHGERGNHVPGLTTVTVSTLEEVLRMLAIADKNRASACTNLNDHSSRSHLILSVNVDGVNRHTGATSAGRLHLIDLAGSERISKSGAAGQALREAQNINKSLSALGDVIAARASRQGHVPYRNSTLTYLLQDSLSADSKTLMLVCVSPVVQSAEESWCSLNFAARVRTVELGKAHKHGASGASA